MKRQIRRGVFETNSSSTHSLTMVSEEEYERLKNGELLIDYWSDTLIEKKDVSEEYSDEDRYMTFDEYWKNIDMETFNKVYTTKNGEKIIAFGYFGYDG